MFSEAGSGWRNYLIIGKGWREHAITKKLSEEENTGEVHVVRGNPGMAGGEGEKVHESDLNIWDVASLIEYVKSKAIDLVVIWPEDPLCNGTANALRDAGIKVFGPDKFAANLEWDKWFAEEFNRKHGIPTPDSQVFKDEEKALSHLEGQSYPIVIKYPGLAGGKWVTITKDQEEATDALHKCFDGKTYNTEKAAIIQEYLTGTEMSVFFFVDTKTATIKYFTSAQDHKTRFETSHDGPNPMTGGMGTVSPSPFEGNASLMKEIHRIWDKFLDGLIDDKIDYQWVVFMGLMVTPNGKPKMLEYNVRFWDPETQAMLARMQSNLGDAMMATAEGEGELAETVFRFRGKALNLVLADPNYPGPPTKGQEIKWLDMLDSETGIIHAGSKMIEEVLETDGGRVVNLVVRGDDETSYVELNDRVLAEAVKITFWRNKPGYRTDIGLGKDSA